jgi:hypothetical protein
MKEKNYQCSCCWKFVSITDSKLDYCAENCKEKEGLDTCY